MADIDTEFVIYPLALRLKLLGFDEPCFAKFYHNHLEVGGVWLNSEFNKDKIDGTIFTSSPTWQSAFSWLIPQIKNEWKVCLGEEGWYIYNLENEIYHGEKALEKLIEIVEKEQGTSNR
jgi:hypothetical protein